MTPDRWRKIKELCDLALQREPDHRNAFIAAACVADEELRRDVESMVERATTGAGVAGGTVLPTAEDAAGTTIRRIGNYTIEAELGRGGMGRVYRAWDPDMRRPVAIKVLLVPGDPESLKRFRLEVHTTASLHHKNIVTLYAGGEESGSPYLVMELLEGQTLGQAIKTKAPLTLVEKVAIMTQVAEGLAYAHSKGVIHRDVKPGNIMLLADGGVKIMDFGVALAASRLTFSGTAHGAIIGTVPYMAPEQLGTGSKANEQTDIFAYGSVYYELLTGKHPFLQFEDDFVALQMAILTQEPPPVSHLAPECPAALELLIHRALAKDRELRYQEFDEVRLDSEAILVELQHDRAQRILAAVPETVQGGDLQKALAMVRQALQLEPGNREGRQLLQSIGRQIQQAQNRERIACLQAEAERHRGERQFGKALKALEIAAGLDSSNESIRLLLAEARTRLNNAIRANQLVAEARFQQQKGHLSEALEKLQAALEIDPDHTDAKLLFPRVREEFDRRLPERKLQQDIIAASEHLTAGRYDQALAVLAEAEGEQSGALDLLELRARIEHEREEYERRRLAERPNPVLPKQDDPILGNLDQATGIFVPPSAEVAAEAPAMPCLSPWTPEALACFEQPITLEVDAPQPVLNERPPEDGSVPLADEPCFDAAANQDRWFHSLETEIRGHQQNGDWPAAMQLAESALSLAPEDSRIRELIRNLRRDRLRFRLRFLYTGFGLPGRLWGRVQEHTAAGDEASGGAFRPVPKTWKPETSHPAMARSRLDLRLSLGLAAALGAFFVCWNLFWLEDASGRPIGLALSGVVLVLLTMSIPVLALLFVLAEFFFPRRLNDISSRTSALLRKYSGDLFDAGIGVATGAIACIVALGFRNPRAVMGLTAMAGMYLFVLGCFAVGSFALVVLPARVILRWLARRGKTPGGGTVASSESAKAPISHWVTRHRWVVGVGCIGVGLALLAWLGRQEPGIVPAITQPKAQLPSSGPPAAAISDPKPAVQGTPSNQKKSLGRVRVKDISPHHANVHNADLQKSSVTGMVSAGELYDYIKVSHGWYLLIGSNGEIGWVAERYLEPVR